MSAVIKSGAAGEVGIRGVDVMPPPPVPSAEAQLVAELERRLEVMQTELAAREEAVDRLTAAAATARSEGHAQGLIEGRQAAEDRSEMLARTVANAASESVAVFRETLSGLEQAVGQLAALALGRIVGEATDRQMLVVDTVHRAIDDLFAGAVVAVEVSREDFADAAPLRAVLPAGCDVHLLDGLPSGACRLRLRMGEVDLDLEGQADRLCMILDPTGASAR